MAVEWRRKRGHRPHTLPPLHTRVAQGVTRTPFLTRLHPLRLYSRNGESESHEKQRVMKGESLCGWELLTTATSPLPTVQGKRRSKVDRETEMKRNRKMKMNTRRKRKRKITRKRKRQRKTDGERENR